MDADCVWESLVSSIQQELGLVESLVRSAVALGVALGRLDVPAVEEQTAKQERLLTELATAATTRREASRRCAGGRAEASKPLGLQVLISAAPPSEATRLRPLHARLGVLRDEFMMTRRRNRMLVEETLDFGQELAARTVCSSLPGRPPAVSTGALFRGSM